MKKAAVAVMLLTVLFSLMNFPIHVYDRFFYYSDDTIKQDIEDNIEFYSTDEVPDIYTRYYNSDIVELLNSLYTYEYYPLEKNEAFKLMYFFDVDEQSYEAPLPMMFAYEHDSNRLSRVKIFEVQMKRYVFCEYKGDDRFSYKVYECPYNENTEQIFKRDCFSDGNFKSTKDRQNQIAIKSTLRYFLPLIIVAIILFLPIFTEGKKSTDEARKMAKTIAKIDFVIIPVWIVILYLKIYL